MGDTMLFAVLEMPTSMWDDNSPLDRAQRRARYIQAAQRIRNQDEEIAELIAQLDSARHDAEAAERFRATYLRERDEARELARKLLPLAEDCIDDLRVESRKAMTDSRRKRIERALADADKTIATAPEWLRHEP